MLPCMDTGGIAQREWSIFRGLIHSFLPSPHSQAPPERGRGLARGLAGGLPAALGRRSSRDPAPRGQPADSSHDALGGTMVDLGSIGRRFCWGLFFFFFNFIYLFIYLFMAVLVLRFCVRAFSSCGKWGPFFIAVRRPLTIPTSLVAEHRLQMRRLSNCGSRA